jgi:hypothetical protein
MRDLKEIDMSTESKILQCPLSWKSDGSRVAPCVQTDGLNEINKRFARLRTRLKAKKCKNVPCALLIKHYAMKAYGGVDV